MQVSEFEEYLARTDADSRMEVAWGFLGYIFRDFDGSPRQKMHLAEELLDAMDRVREVTA